MTLGDFTQQSDAYKRSRPAYPPELLDALITDAGVAAGDPVADLGAGTGIMTQMLIDRGFVVSAIEPNDAMRSQAEVPKAHWVNGSFEASSLSDQSQQWAIAAQAFHWADPPRCLPEIRRILRTQSLFTIIWNNRVKVGNDLVGWAEAAIRRLVPEFDEAYRNRPWDQILESTGDFTFVNRRTSTHFVPMSRERFLQLWKSHNRLNAIAGPDRFAKFFREVSDQVAQQPLDTINVRYDCEAWSARRND